MSDVEIRSLERAQADPLAAYRLRVARIRAGERVPFQVGDKVRVREVESPWRKKKGWLGVVMSTFAEGDAYVRPLGVTKRTRWNCCPTRDYFEKGLYLTQADMAASTLLVPVQP